MAPKVHIQNDAIISGASYNTAQQVEEDGSKEAQNRKKEAYVSGLFLQTIKFFKSELSSKGQPIISMAKWAWDLYMKIVVLLVNGVRTVSWPISHLL